MLRGDWDLALDSIFALRDGEHPECTKARLLWLEDGDYLKALELMPRRNVAERCIWEFYQHGGGQQDKLGALSSVSGHLIKYHHRG